MGCSDEDGLQREPRVDCWATPAPDIEAAVHALLDQVERPVGAPRGFTVKPGAETDRAIVALFDAVGRRP